MTTRMLRTQLHQCGREPVQSSVNKLVAFKAESTRQPFARYPLYFNLSVEQ